MELVRLTQEGPSSFQERYDEAYYKFLLAKGVIQYLSASASTRYAQMWFNCYSHSTARQFRSAICVAACYQHRPFIWHSPTTVMTVTIAIASRALEWPCWACPKLHKLSASLRSHTSKCQSLSMHALLQGPSISCVGT